ncbi:MAG: MFS transporter [Deltaproteobacteria bacterium]|nr:MFS transporter [Deltaproteobacteria bacterium]
MSLSAYQKRLFLFLSVASFFEGYDFTAFGQVRRELRLDLQLSETEIGMVYSVISFGTLLAYLLVRLGDRLGRRKLLTITITGYTTFTFLTGLAPDHYSYTAAQLIARIFLIAEYATSMVYAAEEFPAERRGLVIGVLQTANAFGAIVCAGISPLLTATRWGWRSVYLIAIIPLVLVIYARRGLRETQRFSDLGKRERRSIFALLRSTHARWVFRIAGLWGLMYLCANVAVAYWKDFAISEAGLSSAAAGLSIAIAAVASLPLIFFAGRLIDLIGRRHGSGLIFGLGSIGVASCYLVRGQGLMTFTLIFGIFGVSAMPIVLNALTTELFPTELRADAFAWCNNLLGRIGYVAAPALVSSIADHVGALGPVVAATAIFPLTVVGLIYAAVPETKGRELEQTAKICS